MRRIPHEYLVEQRLIFHWIICVLYLLPQSICFELVVFHGNLPLCGFFFSLNEYVFNLLSCWYTLLYQLF